MITPAGFGLRDLLSILKSRCFISLAHSYFFDTLLLSIMDYHLAFPGLRNEDITISLSISFSTENILLLLLNFARRFMPLKGMFFARQNSNPMSTECIPKMAFSMLSYITLFLLKFQWSSLWKLYTMRDSQHFQYRLRLYWNNSGLIS